MAAYDHWLQRSVPSGSERLVVGLLCYYGQIAEGNHAEIDALIRALTHYGCTPRCVVTEGMADSGATLQSRYGWLPFFRERSPVVVLNLLAGRLLAQPEDVSILAEMNVPVVQLIRLYHQSPEQWRQDASGLGPGAQSMVYSLTQPEMAGDLDEPLDRNFIRKHTLERMADLQRELGEQLAASELKRLASFRDFSSAPGAFGTGVGLALDASAWENDRDLAETYINWSGYAYGSDRIGQFNRASGVEAHRLFAANLKTVEVATMRQYSPEYDLVDCGCYTGCLGGMSVAAKAVSDRRAKLYWSDNSPQGDHAVRDFKEELEATVAAKLLNPNWIEEQKHHGYKGAGEVSSLVNNLYKWSATTDTVDKWVFDRVVGTYIQNPDNLAWLRRDNPYGLEEMTRRLLEAHSPGALAGGCRFSRCGAGRGPCH